MTLYERPDKAQIEAEAAALQSHLLLSTPASEVSEDEVEPGVAVDAKVEAKS